MTDSRNEKAAEIQDAIREILFRDWDPIGVGDNAKLRDEYDSYVAPIYRILAGSRSEQELVDFLFRTMRDAMGLSCESTEPLRPVARRLLALDLRL